MSTGARIPSVRAMDVGEPDLGRFLVEWYGPRASAAAIGEAARRLDDRAVSISATGTQIRLLMALVVPTDDYACGVFAAESADTVAQVCSDAGAPPDRVSATIVWSSTSGH
jgi:hypothetical protein